MVRSMSTTPLVQPAATTPGNDFDLRDQGGGAIRIDVDIDRLLAGAQRVAGDGEAAQGNLDILPLQTLKEIEPRRRASPSRRSIPEKPR